MARTPKETDPEIQVEDLLRLKRHEQPSEEFWSEFDRELHQRMLQTLVKKDPLYVQVLRGLTGRVAQTVGLAGAAAAFAFVAVSETVDVIPYSTNGTQFAIGSNSEAEIESVDLEALVQLSGADIYAIDSFSSDETDASFGRDFGMDRIEVASFNREAYTVQDAMARPGGSVALASLAF